jgi:transcriptional regulator with XRE-family HTH domain
MGRHGKIASDASPSVALVRTAIKDLGLTQTDVAAASGLTKDHLSRVLLGKVSFPRSRDTLHALAEVLKLDPLLFVEYRQQLQVLPESTRRLIAHLKARGITQAEWIQRIVPAYSEGHLQLLLRGGTPFPKEPADIELLARAAEADPLIFGEYLPLATWRDRLLAAAERALPASEAQTFAGALQQIGHWLNNTQQGPDTFAERLLQHFMRKAFTGTAPVDPVLDDALSYMPPLTQYQSAVQRVLRALFDQGRTVEWLSAHSGVPPEDLFAMLNGQLRLKPGETAQRMAQALGLDAVSLFQEA